MPAKAVKSVSIDTDLVDLLEKEPQGASSLVNELLRDYYYKKVSAELLLDNKLKEIVDLEDKLIIEKENKRIELERQIRESQEVIKKLQEEQAQQLDADVKLIEAEKDLSEELKELYRKNKDIASKPVELLDIVVKYRERGYRLGTRQLVNYIKQLSL